MINVYFEPIIAPPFNEGVIRLYLLNEGRKIATEIKKDFERTTVTWDSKPRFQKRVGFTKDKLTIDVFTKDRKYTWVSEGTKGKPRVARGRGIAVDGKARAIKMLPYIPKSPPGQIDAQQGGPIESATPIFRRYALEAGKIRPRKFDVLIKDIWEDQMPEKIQAAIDSAAQKTGYTF